MTFEEFVRTLTEEYGTAEFEYNEKKMRCRAGNS